MINDLKKIYNDKTHIKIKQRKITVMEEHPDTELSQLSFIINRSDIISNNYVKNALFINFDNSDRYFEMLSNYLNKSVRDINKKCDFLIYYKKGSQLNILLCDLKSSFRGATCEETLSQFINSHKFVEYTNNLSEYYEISTDLDIKYFYISIFPDERGISEASPLHVDETFTFKEFSHREMNINPFPIITDDYKSEIVWSEFVSMIP